MILPDRLRALALVLLMAGASFAQSEGQAPPPVRPVRAAQPASVGAQQQPDTRPPAQSGNSTLPDAQTTQPGTTDSQRQPKRILGIMPNYRAVSAGAIPPPPTPKQAFKIATQNSFDYSALIFVGITSLMAEEPTPTRNWAKASPATEDTGGAALSIRRTATTW